MPPEAPIQAPPAQPDAGASSRPLGSPSLYSLRTIPVESGPHSPTNPRVELNANEDTSLLAGSGNQRSYTGLAKYMPAIDPNARKLVFRAGLKVLLLFIVGSVVLGGTLWVALPTLEEADRPMLRIPKSFAQLQDLNTLLKKYRDVYPYRIFVCYVITYLYLQAFSLPGSMYLSILGGAVWGVPRALPLACACVATGATLCYLISAALGPALLAVPSWRARLDAWAEKIEAQRENLMSYLIVIRIAPFPPHWVVNVLCPHVGIGIPRFWISTFFGIMGVSVIHTTIGDFYRYAASFGRRNWPGRATGPCNQETGLDRKRSLRWIKTHLSLLGEHGGHGPDHWTLVSATLIFAIERWSYRLGDFPDWAGGGNLRRLLDGDLRFRGTVARRRGTVYAATNRHAFRGKFQAVFGNAGLAPIWALLVHCGLDQMTSPEDFHLISWRNFGLLSAVVVAVLIPVGLRWSWKQELEVAQEDEVRLAGGPAAAPKGQGKIVLHESDDEGEYVSEERVRQENARGWWAGRAQRKQQQREDEEDAALAALSGGDPESRSEP